MDHSLNMRPSHADAPRDSDQLKKMILKLRWIGQEAEAERLSVTLGARAPGHICVEQPLATD
jgi:hypothetical protein